MTPQVMTDTTYRDADDPIPVDCSECRLWSPLAICEDDTCGCSVCEGIRADREEGVPA